MKELVPTNPTTWKKCGHERTPENTQRFASKQAKSGYKETCLTCGRARTQRYGKSALGLDAGRRKIARKVESGQQAAIAAAHRDRRKAYELALFAESPDKRVRATASRVVILSDLQIPFEDPPAVEQALQVLDVAKPDTVVLNGDIVDCYAESAFVKDPQKFANSTEEQHKRARLLMERLAHVPQKIWMGGNHEDRWRRQIWADPQLKHPTVRNLLYGDPRNIDLNDPVGSFARLFDMPKYGFAYYPYSHRLYLAEGNLVITHGKYVSRHSGYSAKRTLQWLGRSCIVGHTHRLGTYLITQDGREHGAWENGCLCQLEPEYDDAPNWQQGFSVVNIDGPEFHVIQVPIIRRAGQPVAVWRS